MFYIVANYKLLVNVKESFPVLSGIKIYYDQSIKNLEIKSGEHLEESAFTGKKANLSNNSAACDNLFHCNYLPSFDNFSILAQENKKYLLEIKKSFLIMTDKKNFNYATLYLFDKVS